MMQCSPPFYSAGHPNPFGFFIPYNHSIPQVPPSPIYPEIIGEGEVASVVYPDGSVHLYFIPINKRLPPSNWHGNYNPYGNNIVGAYYVRSISNPITPAVFNQQCQKMNAGPYSSPCFISDCNLNLPSPGFQLKFHNDCWTSTTDLHYFFPCLRRCEWFPPTQPLRCASVQVDIPVKEKPLNDQEMCSKPRLCSESKHKNMSGTDSVDECLCYKHSSSASSITNKRKQDKRNSRKCKARQQKQKLAIKKSDVVCECHQASTSNKSISTYADQASGCAANERNTQTCTSASSAATSCPVVKSSVVNRSNVKTELWFPKTSLSGKAMTSKSSEKILGVFESTHSSASCCCSDTEGD